MEIRTDLDDKVLQAHRSKGLSGPSRQVSLLLSDLRDPKAILPRKVVVRREDPAAEASLLVHQNEAQAGHVALLQLS